MNIFDLIYQLESKCVHTQCGIPEEIFLFFSRHIPIVNVDLLIKDEKSRTLLAWRDDHLCGRGWHVPGGIIKYKQTISDCIKDTAIREIGTEIELFFDDPIKVQEIILPQLNRGHFISLLYHCIIPDSYVLPKNNPCTVGYLQWHDRCPYSLIQVHEVYRKVINDTSN